MFEKLVRALNDYYRTDKEKPGVFVYFDSDKFRAYIRRSDDGIWQNMYSGIGSTIEEAITLLAENWIKGIFPKADLLDLLRSLKNNLLN